MLIDADWCWLMLIDADWWWLMMTEADWCWFILIDADWYADWCWLICWLMLTEAHWCWLMLIDADRIYQINADWCWLVLNGADWWWLMLINAQIGLNQVFFCRSIPPKLLRLFFSHWKHIFFWEQESGENSQLSTVHQGNNITRSAGWHHFSWILKNWIYASTLTLSSSRFSAFLSNISNEILWALHHQSNFFNGTNCKTCFGNHRFNFLPKNGG